MTSASGAVQGRKCPRCDAPVTESQDVRECNEETGELYGTYRIRCSKCQWGEDRNFHGDFTSIDQARARPMGLAKYSTTDELLAFLKVMYQRALMREVQRRAMTGPDLDRCTEADLGSWGLTPSEIKFWFDVKKRI